MGFLRKDYFGIFPSGNCSDFIKYMFGLFPFNLHKGNREGGQRNKVGGVTAESVGWSSLPKVLWPKREGLVFITGTFYPFKCHYIILPCLLAIVGYFFA